jgi:cellulose synthase/poly-beta-1,6-N-acetylglucosamine synthase-like glycosyltransferase
MQIFDYIIAHYGWAGTALIALLLILFFIQIYYHAIRYGKIAKYKMSKRKKLLNDAPPISVVIPLMSEDFGFIHERLPRFLQQRYEPGYEVVIIFIGTNGDFYEELESMRLQYSNLLISKL